MKTRGCLKLREVRSKFQILCRNLKEHESKKYSAGEFFDNYCLSRSLSGLI